MKNMGTGEAGNSSGKPGVAAKGVFGPHYVLNVNAWGSLTGIGIRFRVRIPGLQARR